MRDSLKLIVSEGVRLMKVVHFLRVSFLRTLVNEYGENLYPLPL